MVKKSLVPARVRICLHLKSGQIFMKYAKCAEIISFCDLKTFENYDDFEYKNDHNS